MKRQAEPCCEDIFEYLPIAALVFNRELKLKNFNRSAFRLIAWEADQVLDLMAGVAFGCVNAVTAGGGCGTTAACSECGLRNAITTTSETNAGVRQRTAMFLVRDGQVIDARFAIATSPLPANGFVVVTLDTIDEDTIENSQDHSFSNRLPTPAFYQE